jgi:hypothetical protein
VSVAYLGRGYVSINAMLFDAQLVRYKKGRYLP